MGKMETIAQKEAELANLEAEANQISSRLMNLSVQFQGCSVQAGTKPVWLDNEMKLLNKKGSDLQRRIDARRKTLAKLKSTM